MFDDDDDKQYQDRAARTIQSASKKRRSYKQDKAARRIQGAYTRKSGGKKKKTKSSRKWAKTPTGWRMVSSMGGGCSSKRKK